MSEFVTKAQVNMVAVDRLQTHPRNPRRGDLRRTKESIAENGFWGSLIVQKGKKPTDLGTVLIGNTRFRAAVELGYSRLPVQYVDLPEAMQRRLLLADNKTSDHATYDGELLADMLRELDEIAGSVEGTGFDQDEVDALIEQYFCEEDEEEDESEEDEEEDESEEDDDEGGEQDPGDTELEGAAHTSSDAGPTVDGSIKRLTLFFSPAEHERVEETFDTIMNEQGLETDAAALIFLIEYWEEN